MRPARRTRAALLLAAPLAGGAAWQAGLHLPAAAVEGPAVIGEARVFGYATLTSPWVRLFVIGRPAPSRPATLTGFRREGRDLAVDQAAAVSGRAFLVDAAGMRRLDRVERLGEDYERTEKTLTDGRPAWVYRKIGHSRR
jgi:hypothetical protein